MNNNEQISRSGSSASGSNRPRNQPEGPAGGSQDSQAKSGDAVSRLTEVAQQAGSQVKQTVTSLASEANQKAKGVLNQQLTAGAELVANGAESAKHAADNLNENAPHLADLLRRAADKIDGLSRDLRGQSIEGLIRTASDFTRRQPALVFGLASLAGFCLLRALKANPSNGLYSLQHQNPSQEDTRPRFRPHEQRFDGEAQFHGT